MRPKKYAIIDADSIVYAAGFACQTPRYTIAYHTASFKEFVFDSLSDVKEHLIISLGLPAGTRLTETDCKAMCATFEKTWILEPIANCLHTVDQMMNKIVKATGCHSHMTVLSGTDNFRYYIDPDYKANRKDSQKPKYFDQIRDHFVNKHKAKIVHKMEADDAVGILATAVDEDVDKDYVIVSIDKDLDQIPGLHYNWKKDTHYTITKAEAKEFIYTQLITGDATDNIKGLPKWGPAKAKKLLKGIEWETDPDAENEALRRIGLQYAIMFDDPEAEMLKTLRLVTILRKHPSKEETDEDSER